MTPEDFKAWRAAMRFTQVAAAEALQLSEPTILNYERGRRPDGKPAPIPYTTALACAALYHRLEPWGTQVAAITSIRPEMIMTTPPGHPPFATYYQNFILRADGTKELLDDSVFTSKEEALRHIHKL